MMFFQISLFTRWNGQIQLFSSVCYTKSFKKSYFRTRLFSIDPNKYLISCLNFKGVAEKNILQKISFRIKGMQK